MAESIMLPVMKSISCIAPRPPLPRVLRVKRCTTNRGAGIRKSAQVAPEVPGPKAEPCRCGTRVKYVGYLWTGELSGRALGCFRFLEIVQENAEARAGCLTRAAHLKRHVPAVVADDRIRRPVR